MITGLLQTSRRWIVAFIVAGMVAVIAAYGPVLLNEVAGMSVSTPAYACQPAGGAGC